jgi:hypothetical protein
MMKKTVSLTVAPLILFLIFWSTNLSFSQDFTDKLKAKLPKTYQYKLLKAENSYKNGIYFLEKGGAMPDSLQLTDSTLNENGKEVEKKVDTNYYIYRIKAAQCFINSNLLTFGILDKFISDFWKKFQGDKKPLELLIKIENAAYDSLYLADGMRAKAEKDQIIVQKIHLVSCAEYIEERALFRLKKVLYAYMNLPEMLNVAWLFSDDKTDPLTPNTEQEIHLSAIQLDLDTIKKDTIHRATSLYNLMHVSENKIDSFNEFISTRYPTNAESYLIDFQLLDKNVVDSLKKKWQAYTQYSQFEIDTFQSNVFGGSDTLPKNEPGSNLPDKGISKVPQHKSAEAENASNNEILQTIVGDSIERGFLYRVQISACRRRIPAKELRRVYSGQEKIIESYEDHWYKYTIGTFKFYRDARGFKDIIHVKGAFVIAYFNGKRIKITIEMTK